MSRLRYQLRLIAASQEYRKTNVGVGVGLGGFGPKPAQKMRRLSLVLAGSIAIAAAAAVAQPRITSFTSSGLLTWTNFARIGAYKVEWADSPGGTWHAFDTATNLNSVWVATNRITVQVPVSNTPAFYRVGWTAPDATGLWDYCGYYQGTLVITGQLAIVSTGIEATNPPVEGVQGSYNLGYAGPATTNLWYFGPGLGTGWFTGNLTVGYAHLYIVWPTNVIDDNIVLIGTIWPDNYTGTWNYGTWSGPRAGPFVARRR
jgi:hypothetical protein